MYAAVAIIPATSSLSQTRPIFHGVRTYIAYSIMIISNQTAERPIRSILGLRDVTLSRNVQNQTRSWRELACYTPGKCWLLASIGS